MNYIEFLISQILRDEIEWYNTISYDILYQKAIKIDKIYSKTEDKNVSLYEDIQGFIRDNKTLLIKMIEKDL